MYVVVTAKGECRDRHTLGQLYLGSSYTVASHRRVIRCLGHWSQSIY